MATQQFDFKRGENTARSAIVVVLGALFLLGGLGPQNTRAVFLTNGGLPGAQAFTATLGPNGQVANFLSGVAGPRGPVAGGPARDRSGARPVEAVTPRNAVPATDTAQTVPGTALPGVSVPVGRDAGVDAGLGNGPAGGGGGQPFTPGIRQPIGAAPGFGGTPTGPGNPTNPVDPTNPTNPVNPTDPTGPTPVSSIPEPSTWAMLLGGFLLIGWSLRRARRYSGALGTRIA